MVLIYILDGTATMSVLDVEDFLEKLHKENTDSNIRFDATPVKG